MTEIHNQPSLNDEEGQRKTGYGQYQHQTMNLDNTIGLIFMSILSIIMLAGLLRQQARSHELAVRLAQQK